MNRRQFLLGAATATVGAGWLGAAGYTLFGGKGGRQLLNASYDATRDLYRRVNRLFAERHRATTGEGVRLRASHGGSGSQARAVIDGLPADVATLAMWSDTDAIRQAGLIRPGWEERFPNHSAPYSSTIVFVVRKGNPYGVRDWADLARLPREPGAGIVTANPKTSGAAKLGLVACWGAVLRAGGSERDAEELVRAVYGRVKSLESSSRAATVTFARKGLGGVHLTWENEAYLQVRESKGQLEIVHPTRSVLAEPRVAVVDRVVERNGRAELAEEYLRFLYEPAAQEVIAEEYYRPVNLDSAGRFPPLQLFRLRDVVPGGWDEAQHRFFADGGVFDRVYTSG
jgi:sulfate transport system substrate-binding protein